MIKVKLGKSSIYCPSIKEATELIARNIARGYDDVYPVYKRYDVLLKAQPGNVLAYSFSFEEVPDDETDDSIETFILPVEGV
jgi:hypothetical protein